MSESRESLTPWSTWLHVKSGSTYTVVGVAINSTNDEEEAEYVVYLSHKYQQLRTRRLDEYLDGRFVRVTE